MSVALLAFSSQAADTPSGSTNAPATTNAPHFSSKFAERLHQLKERDATNKVPDRLLSPLPPRLPVKPPVVLWPPLPPEPGSPVPRYKPGI
jgi:hypothetical protein